MYTTSIIMLLTWPALIFASWLAVRIAFYFYEKSQKKVEKLIEE